VFGNVADLDVHREIDQIKKSLLQVRRQVMIDDYGEETEVVGVAEQTLSSKQEQYLLELLRDPQIDEEDAELVLTLLGLKGEISGTRLDAAALDTHNLYGKCDPID
jgi:hypothetical protein